MKLSKSLVAGVAVIAVIVGGLAFALLTPSLLGAKAHQMQVSFTTADGLVSGSDVLEAGAKIGTIAAIEPTQDNAALVTMQIQDAHWPLHQGVTADIRPKSLLGEKYIDIHDGRGNGVYSAAAVLHTTAKAVPVELDQFINSLDEPTRNAARVLLNDLGAGVAGRGNDLNQAIAAGKANLANLAVFGKTLNARDPDLDRILVGLDGVLGKITTTDQLTQLSQLITNGQLTLNAIETQQAAFSRSFVDAQTALGELNTAIDSAVPSLRNTLTVAPQLLDLTGQESNLLAFIGSKADNNVLSQLDAGLIQGPTTTGGALESTGKAIFRICLTNPGGLGPGGAGSSCTGSKFTPPKNSAPASYDGGSSSSALLAAWLGA